MNKTKNDLPKDVRQKVIKLLGQHLADSADLYSQCKQAHWNVKGPSFIALHKLFDEVAEAIEGYVDEIAERLVQLGGTAKGTVRAAAGKTSLPEYPLDIEADREHVKALSSAIAFWGAKVRKGIDQADEMEDADTADLFTEISRDLDKWLWFVESHNH